jgi:aubergine-like protein
MGHVLAKVHIADSMLTSSGYDMHSDGTTRDHRKYLGSQITLADGNVMSMGYTMVMTEDTETLLDAAITAAITILQELADIHGSNPEQVNDNFLTILRRLAGLMSDRASVNKSFNKAINQKRRDILQDDSLQLEFVYCSAHYLLGLSSESEKVMKAIQKEIGDGKLGRDTLAKFKCWSSGGESAVARYIRTACDVMGPRGDNKSGCRDAWEAYCSLKDVNSLIKSYRSNRFNNYFEGAATLHYHRHDIEDFFSNYRSSPNLKLQSVLADCQSDEIDTLLSALGITYYVVTGPFWQLITSKTKYLDLFKYLTPMREKLVQCALDASPVIDNPISFIPEFSVDGKDVLPALINVPSRDLLCDILQRLFQGFIAVTDRQLTDFLPEGKYHNIQDPERRQKMQHTQLTNLIGEACLGDLDYSMFTKRHASLHYRSFTNMMARNHTMSAWFHQKTEAQQSHLLAVSKAKAAPLRKKHQEIESMVISRRKEHLEALKREKEAKLEKVLIRKASLTQKVKDHGGPCLLPSDVRKLVKSMKSETQATLRKALNDEIQYNKTVLGAKSKLLKTSKLSNDQIWKNLQEYLGGDRQEELSGNYQNEIEYWKIFVGS